MNYPSVTSLYKIGPNIQYLDGDRNLPYVQGENKNFYYFTLTGKDYVLAMVYSKDLQEKQS